MWVIIVQIGSVPVCYTLHPCAVIKSKSGYATAEMKKVTQSVMITG